MKSTNGGKTRHAAKSSQYKPHTPYSCYWNNCVYTGNQFYIFGMQAGQSTYKHLNCDSCSHGKNCENWLRKNIAIIKSAIIFGPPCIHCSGLRPLYRKRRWPKYVNRARVYLSVRPSVCLCLLLCAGCLCMYMCRVWLVCVKQFHAPTQTIYRAASLQPISHSLSQPARQLHQRHVIVFCSFAILL